jgi:hypothetical protein
MNNKFIEPANARPATVALFRAHARHPQTPIAEVEARLLDVCRKEKDMDMYPVLLAALREIYRIEGVKRGNDR